MKIKVNHDICHVGILVLRPYIVLGVRSPMQ